VKRKIKEYDSEALETGKKLFGDIEIAKGVFDNVNKWDPDFSMLVQKFGWAKNGMYGRNILDDKTRELCSIAALTVLGRWSQLKTHIKFALRVGASRKEVLEVILQMCVFGGFPVTFTALEVLEETFVEFDEMK